MADKKVPIVDSVEEKRVGRKERARYICKRFWWLFLLVLIIVVLIIVLPM